MARIFLSHSNRDDDEAAGLKSWLAARDFPTVFLDSDKDTGIQPGAGWEKTLYRELDRAQAVLLVVTDHWLSSKWCFAEFTQARALGKDIIPLIVGPTQQKLVGEDLQAIDLLADRQDGLERLERRLRVITQQSSDGFDLANGVAPFPGLAAFEEDQAAVFFGRDPDIRRMLERLRLRHIRGGERLILLLGASGSGKSSLLRAGLIPRLKRDRGNWIALPPFRPGRTPRAQLVDCLLAGVGAIGLPQLAAWRDALEGDAPDAALAAVARTLRQQNAAPDASVLLPIDQAEELFTLAMAAERADFLALLSRLLDETLPFVAVATLRADHLSGLQSESALTVPIDLQPLDAMPLDRIAALVRGPARLVDLRVDDGLIAALTRDAERPDALPLVAVALNELHARFGPDGALTLVGYESLGARDAGISPLDAVVRERAESALGAPATAAAAEKEEDRALRDAFVPWLVRLQEETGQFIRQAAALDRFPALARTQLERLVEARLLVRRGGRTSADPAMLEVTHEALFRVWPRLAGWLEQERDFLIARNRIEQAFHDWRKLSKDKADNGLLTGAILDQARQGLAAHPTRFGKEESEYIRRSDALARAEAARKRRMRRSLFAALLAALVILAVGAGTSFYLYRQQREATTRAEAVLAAATRTANGLVFDLVQKFKQSGLSNALAREILQRAADLQDRLAQGNEGNIDLLHGRAAMLDERAQSLADFGDPQGAAEAAEESLTILRTLAQREPDKLVHLRNLSVSLRRIADIRLRSDPTGALALYDESLGIFRTLAQREPDNSGFQRDLSVSLSRIADIRLRSDPVGALALYDESLTIFRKLAQREPDNSGFQSGLSVSLSRIADIRLRGDPAGALALYAESLGIFRTLAQREPDNSEFQRDLSASLSRIADIRLRGDPAGALALYAESLGIFRTLAQREPDNSGFQRDLSASLSRIADIRLRGDPAGALALYAESLGIFRTLAQREPDNSGFQRDLSASLDNIADIRQRGDPASALALYDESLGIRRTLAQREPDNSEFQRDLSASLSRIADIRLRGDPAGALALYAESLGIFRTLAQREPDNSGFQRDLSVSLDNIADIRQRGDPIGALALYDESLGIRRTLAQREPDNSGFQRDLSISLDRIADIRRRSDPIGALALYDESLGIARTLAQREPDNSGFQRDLSVSLDKTADIRLRSDPIGALALYDESLGIRRTLAQREPDNSGFQSDLSLSLNNIADIRRRSDPIGALALYDESLGIRRTLAQREPDNSGFQRDLSVSLNRIADIRLRSDHVGALALYDESLGIARTLAQREPDNSGFQRDLFVSIDRIADIRLRSDLAGALALYDEGLGIFRRLTQREPDNSGFQRDLSISLDNIADIRRRSDPAGALALYDESLGIRRTLAQREPDNIEFQTDVVVSLVRTGQAEGRAEASLSEALAILTGLNARGRLSSDQQGWIGLVQDALREARGQGVSSGAATKRDGTP